jgi:hypothetical protein
MPESWAATLERIEAITYAAAGASDRKVREGLAQVLLNAAEAVSAAERHTDLEYMYQRATGIVHTIVLPLSKYFGVNGA